MAKPAVYKRVWSIRVFTRLLTFAAWVALAMVTVTANAQSPVHRLPVYIDSQKVLENFGKQGGNPLVPGEAYRVQTDRRTANGNIEIHEKETDIFYVMDGSATLIAGGTAVEPKTTRPGQMTAKDIMNGQTYNLKKGDIVVIPAGQPHWFKQVNGFINYLTVKSVQP
jgi:mannose-6-phosphate isomerase-like protein (cupin superfamily)